METSAAVQFLATDPRVMPGVTSLPGRAIKVLALIEATSVGGPAGNLIDFCRRARDINGAAVDASLVTFNRTSKRNASDPFSAGGLNQFVEAALEAGIQVELIEERFRFDPAVIARLRQIVEDLRPDIIQTHNVKSHFLMRASGLPKRFPWIAFHHGYTDTDLKMRAYNKLDRWSLPHADRVVTVSRAFATQLESGGVRADRIRVVHNSINPAKFDDARIESGDGLRKRLGISPEESVVLAVGRLSREKGHAVLMSAFNSLLRSGSAPFTRLVIVGDGPERQALAATAESAGIADRVIIAGQVNDVRAYYKMADLMVLPSYTEGSPNVLLEAMAARVPIVATAVGGVPEIVTDNESALLTSAGDTTGLASAMSVLLNDQQLGLRLAANARAVVCLSHSPESRMDDLINIYHEIGPMAACSGCIRRGTRSGSDRVGYSGARSGSDGVAYSASVQPARMRRAATDGLTNRISSVIKNAVFFIYLYCGYVQLRDAVLALLGRSRAVVLYYHRIGQADVLTKPASEFGLDLDYLSRRYRCISLAELCETIRTNASFRQRSAVITFDDGYRDNFLEAAPLLKAAALPATFFVATGFIDTDRDFAHDLRAEGGDGSPKGAGARYPKLRWDDLRAMQDDGFEIAAHTVNHTNLGHADRDLVQAEVTDSLAALDRELGARQRAFSFPWGKPDDISATAVQAVKQAGYYAAASAYGGANGRGSNLFDIRRVDVGNGNLDRLAFKARVAGFDLDYFKRRIRSRLRGR